MDTHTITQKPWRGALALLLTLVLLATACGADNDDDTAAVAADVAIDDGVEQSGDAEGSFAEPEAIVTDGDDSAGRDDSAEEAMQDDDAAAIDAPEELESSTGLFPDAAVDGEIEPAEDGTIRVFVDTARDNESTFALDVDTGAYSLARRFLESGQLPDQSTVRVEEYVNSFDYSYPDADDELDVFIDAGPSPFDADNVVVRIGVQAERVDEDDRPPAALTFIVDTSGSMDQENRLGLVKESLLELVDNLDRTDSVAIVTYDTNAGIVLEPTSVRDRDEISDAIKRLEPGGSTNLEAGIQTGYELAREAFIDTGINRVILASDGIANVGLTEPGGLADQIRLDADNEIQLVTVGFGMDGFNDTLMEQLADNGDGFYAYVDTFDEANKVFNEDLVSTLFTVAVDAKVQVIFETDHVEAYRLIGFENRAIRDDDFEDNTVDAGELGAGHSVTALYELTLAQGTGGDDPLGEVRLRWERPGNGSNIEIDHRFDADILTDEWSETSDEFQLATTVAAWAEILRGSQFADDLSLDQIAEEAARLATVFDTDDVDELADLTARAAGR